MPRCSHNIPFEQRCNACLHEGLLREYMQNEANNAHLDNAVLLACEFGTSMEQDEGRRLVAKHKYLGYLPSGGEEYELRMNRKYYKLLKGQ